MTEHLEACILPIPDQAGCEFRSMIEAEAARRREAYRQGGNRRRSERSMKIVTTAADIVAGVGAVSDQQEPIMGTWSFPAGNDARVLVAA